MHCNGAIVRWLSEAVDRGVVDGLGGPSYGKYARCSLLAIPFQSTLNSPAMPHPQPSLTRLLAALAMALVALPLSLAQAQEWTRFRGPNGSGVSDAKTIPVSWSEDDYRWRIKLPGEGHAAPVVWGDRLFTTCADAASGERYLCCIDTRPASIRRRGDAPR
jgi:hypothetical protein